MEEQQTRYTSIEGDEKNEVLAHRYHMDMDRYLTIIYHNVVISYTVIICLIFNALPLQSQVKQLQETIRSRKRNKTSSVRKKSTTNKGIKTNRRGSARSRKR